MGKQPRMDPARVFLSVFLAVLLYAGRPEKQNRASLSAARPADPRPVHAAVPGTGGRHMWSGRDPPEGRPLS